MSCEFYSSKIHTARKNHTCSMCSCEIKPGEKYNRSFGKYEGVIFNYKYCLDCKRAIDYYTEEIGECEYTYEDVDYFLQNCFCDKCEHGYKTENSLDDCKEDITHCPKIQKVLKEQIKL